MGLVSDFPFLRKDEFAQICQDFVERVEISHQDSRSWAWTDVRLDNSQSGDAMLIIRKRFNLDATLDADEEDELVEIEASSDEEDPVINPI
ncbi:hypothetical protein FQN57_007123 [Myotisia sp. PD_48]|nr:hypothetical protein FQN57_007123 [Myotisia sp. PD_48]